MLKPLTILSVSTVALLASTSAFSHVICAPDSPQGRVTGHTHNQAYTVPRIVQTAAPNPNQARYLQQQRARQQAALANQQRINQQRRAQALQKQQQVAAQKARQIQLQRLAAQRAQQARQQAAVARARQAKLQAQQAARYVPAKQVVRYTPPVVQQRYVQPTYVQPTYVEPVVYYQAPAPVVYQAPVYYAPQPASYTPSTSYVSVSVGGGGDNSSGSFRGRQVSQPVKQVRHAKHYPNNQGAVVKHLQVQYQQAKHQQPSHHQAKQYNHAGKSYGSYKVGGNGGERSQSGHRQQKRQQAASHMDWKAQNQSGKGHTRGQSYRQSHGQHGQYSSAKK